MMFRWVLQPLWFGCFLPRRTRVVSFLSVRSHPGHGWKLAAAKRDAENHHQKQRHHHQVNGIECVEVTLPLPELGSVTILEATAESQDTLVDLALLEEDEKLDKADDALSLPTGDPYGAVLWPASSAVAHALIPLLSIEQKKGNTNVKVLELGAGTGLVSLAALRAGASNVIATDYERLPLQLLEYAAQHLNDLPQQAHTAKSPQPPRLTCQLLDLCQDAAMQPLPAGADFVVAADVLYQPKTGRGVARRVVEALLQSQEQNQPCTIILGDSPGRPGRPAFLQELRQLLSSTFPQTSNSNSKTSIIDFHNVTGWTVQGPRHDLICGPGSLSVTPKPRELTVALLVLRSKDYVAHEQ